ncbi:MAG: DapH/DapD/GlmU-related protein [Candidatus Micrarchaeota archaeon]
MSEVKPVANKSKQIGANFSCGYNVIVLEDAVIGDDVSVGNNVIIHKNTVIEKGVRIQDNVIVGKQPVSTAFSTFKRGEAGGAVIGEGSIICAGSIVYGGTKIGKNCIIADQAIVREGCIFGEKVKIGKKAIVEFDVTLGNKVSIQAYVLVGEKTVIEEGAFIGPHVSMALDKFMDNRRMDPVNLYPIVIKKGARIGENATIFPGITLGKNCWVGAGTVVTKNVNENEVVLGNPGRVVKKIVQNE